MSGTPRTHAARALVNRAALHLLSEDDALPFALAIEEQMARLAPQQETLDVDRLARALKVCDTRRTVEWNAPRVAAEYARLDPDTAPEAER